MNSLVKWLTGFTKLGTLSYKPGWNKWKFLPLYLVDYGTHVLTGGAVVSWSRWFYDNRKTNRVAAFMNRLLGHIEDDHGQMAGPPLWGTVDLPAPIRILIICAWIGVVFIGAR